MPGFIFVPIVRVRNVGFLAIVRNVVCTNYRGANFFDERCNYAGKLELLLLER